MSLKMLPDIAKNVTANNTDATESVTVNKAQRHDSMIAILRAEPTINVDQLAEAFHVNRRTILRDLEDLKAKKR